MNMTRQHGGKTWIAPKVLIREDVRALPGPSHEARHADTRTESLVLAQRRWKVSLRQNDEEYNRNLLWEGDSAFYVEHEDLRGSSSPHTSAMGIANAPPDTLPGTD